jgi:hypothetical protein
LRSCWAWVPVDCVDPALGAELVAELVADEPVEDDPLGDLAGGGVAPPPRNSNT